MYVAGEEGDADRGGLGEFLEALKGGIAFGDVRFVTPFVKQVVIKLGQREDACLSSAIMKGKSSERTVLRFDER